jgi:hypothetical protein
MQSNYPIDIKSVSQSIQPHRFFERNVTGNLPKLVKELQDRYSKIERAELLGVSPLKDDESWKQSSGESIMFFNFTLTNCMISTSLFLT